MKSKISLAFLFCFSLMLNACSDVNISGIPTPTPVPPTPTPTATPVPTATPTPSPTPGTINTIAGTMSESGYTTNAYPAISPWPSTTPTPTPAPSPTKLNNPSAIATDSLGNLYFADTGNNVVRMVPKIGGTYFNIPMIGGYIYTVAGTTTTGTTPIAGYEGQDVASAASSGTAVELNAPSGVAVDSSGNLYIADTGNNVIRVVINRTTPSSTYIAGTDNSGNPWSAGKIYTIAGTTTTGSTPASGFTADGSAILGGSLNAPKGIAVDSAGNVYYADSGNKVVRMIVNTATGYTGYFGSATTDTETETEVTWTQGDVYTIAGNSGVSGDSTTATAANTNGNANTDQKFTTPTGLAVDSKGNVYVTDEQRGVIYAIINTTGTYFGNSSWTAGNIYVVSGTAGTTVDSGNGSASSATFKNPWGITLDTLGNLYIADDVSQTVRMILNVSGTYLGISMSSGQVEDVAGMVGQSGTPGDGALATAANLSGPKGVAVDTFGNLYIADTGHDVVRMVLGAMGGDIYTVIGTPATQPANTSAIGVNGAATSAQLDNPFGTVVDAQGNLYVADTGENVVYMVPKISGTYYGISMTGGNLYVIAGTAGSSGTSTSGTSGTSGKLNGPTGIAVDSANNLYIADTGNGQVWILINQTISTSTTYGGTTSSTWTAGDIYAIAGSGNSSSSTATNQVATSEYIASPTGLAVDSNDNVYISDPTTFVVRMVVNKAGSYFGVSSSSYTVGHIYTIAGILGSNGWAGDGTPQSGGTIELNQPEGLAVDSVGNLYIADSANSVIRMLVNSAGTYFGTAYASAVVGQIFTIAGKGQDSADSGDNGSAVLAEMETPYGVAIDSHGNLYIADYGSDSIRMAVNLTNTYFGISMIAGNIYSVGGTADHSGYSGDMGTATTAEMATPQGIAVDADGNLFISDSGNYVIREITN